MNKTWIKKNNNTPLILFFNGWGMDKSSIAHLNSDNFDLVEFNDYTVLNFNQNDYLDYEDIYVVAWSLGVWAASYSIINSKLPIKKTIAINGTQNPIHATEGINPDIFKGTIDGWNEKNRGRFFMRTLGGKAEYETHLLKLGTRTTDNQKDELVAIYHHIENEKVFNLKFNTALIGEQDAIFTPENQENYWKGKTNFQYIDMPHYPFLKFSNWDEIINL